MTRPQPWRITLALDAADLYDPELSAALGVPVGEVDRWEEGRTIPTPAQLAMLAELSNRPIGFFHLPDPPETFIGWMCDRTRRKHGCTLVVQRYAEVAPGVWKSVEDRPDADRLPLP